MKALPVLLFAGMFASADQAFAFQPVPTPIDLPPAIAPPVAGRAPDRLPLPAPSNSRMARPPNRKPAGLQPRYPDAIVPAVCLRPLTGNEFTASLIDGTRLIGVPCGTGTLPLHTEFGRSRVPLKLIAEIEGVEGGRMKVRFKNGDVLTARIGIGRLKIRTCYGELAVPITSLQRLQRGRVLPVARRPASPKRKPLIKQLLHMHKAAELPPPAPPIEEEDPIAPPIWR